MLENISFTDVQLKFAGGGTAEEAAADVPQVAGEYFQIGTPPAYGMYARNVRGLTLNNVRFEMATPDVRPAVVFDHVEDAVITNLSARAIRRPRPSRGSSTRKTSFWSARECSLRPRRFCRSKANRAKKSSSTAATCRRPQSPSCLPMEQATKPSNAALDLQSGLN